jgi:hypothetical protein
LRSRVCGGALHTSTLPLGFQYIPALDCTLNWHPVRARRRELDLGREELLRELAHATRHKH